MINSPWILITRSIGRDIYAMRRSRTANVIHAAYLVIKSDRVYKSL